MSQNTTFLVLTSSIVFFFGNYLFYRANAHFCGSRASHNDIVDLEIARGIFCFFVFLGHSVLGYNQIVYDGSFWPPLEKFRTINHLAATGIDGFFFITGYLFASQLALYKVNKLFLLNRCIRLFPALLLATACITVANYFYNDKTIDLEGLYGWIIPFYSYTDIFGDLIYGHFWSLRNEWIFYLLVFVVAFSASKRPNLYVVLALLFFVFFDITFSMILCGVIVFFVSNIQFVKRILKFRVAILIILSLYILFLYFAPLEHFSNPLRHMLRWASTFLFGLLLVNQRLSAMLHPRLRNFFIRSGTPAYSLYLVHGAVLFFSLKLCVTHLDMNKYGFLVWPFFVVPVWLLTGWLLYVFAERPYYSWKLKVR